MVGDDFQPGSVWGHAGPMMEYLEGHPVHRMQRGLWSVTRELSCNAYSLSNSS